MNGNENPIDMALSVVIIGSVLLIAGSISLGLNAFYRFRELKDGVKR